MQTRRSSVLGKRSYQPDTPSVASSGSDPKIQQVPTPDPSPKRARVSVSGVEGDHNKENVPPLVGDVLMTSAVPSPTRPRTTSLRRTASSPATPTRDIAHLSLATPPITPPRGLLPVYSRARALLRPTANSTTNGFAGRDSERKSITDFITSFVDADATSKADSGALYISGSPGCGKTALVNSILSSMALTERDDVHVVSLNCMAFQSLDGLWDRLADSLCPSKASSRAKHTGRTAVERILNNMKHKCLLVLDELDNITRSTQSLESLFSLISSIPDVLRVIGIANTHTLASSTSVFINLASVEIMHFAPYTSEELLKVLKSRLEPLYEDDTHKSGEQASKLFPNPSLVLLSKKVASMTGDVRVIFEVLRGAIDLAVIAHGFTNTDPDFMNSTPPTVTPANILAALKSHTPTTSSPSSAPKKTNSETFCKVQGLGIQAQLVLLSIALSTKRIEAGLVLTSTTHTTSAPTPSRRSTSPSKRSVSPTKRSRSPIKRSRSDIFSAPSTLSSSSLDVNQLYSYYSAVLTKRTLDMFSPTSRSEFGDLVGMMEGLGLLSSSCGTTAAKAKRTFGRSASFSANANSAVTSSVISLGSGVWIDEIIRGMGITEEPPCEEADAKLRGVHSIWSLELKKMDSELAANERGRNARAAKDGAFDDAQMED